MLRSWQRSTPGSSARLSCTLCLTRISQKESCGRVETMSDSMFILQLYLNYRMKSVAHLPWRQMTYKFLNTIIDDLFAFVIKMPMLHRLSVFRDDIVFLIYIYQRWIYRVDKKRANEFGYACSVHYHGCT